MVDDDCYAFAGQELLQLVGQLAGKLRLVLDRPVYMSGTTSTEMRRSSSKKKHEKPHHPLRLVRLFVRLRWKFWPELNEFWPKSRQ